jgi:hypothetical protein
MTSFWRRPFAVAFWVMFFLNVPFVLLASGFDVIFLFVLMICEFSAFTFLRFYYLREIRFRIERIEKMCFWAALASAMATLFLEFLATSHINFFFLMIMSIGLSAYGLVHLLSPRHEERTW